MLTGSLVNVKVVNLARIWDDILSNQKRPVSLVPSMVELLSIMEFFLIAFEFLRTGTLVYPKILTIIKNRLLKKVRKKQPNQKSDPPNKIVKKEASKKTGKNKAGSDNETDYNPNSDSDSKPKRKTAKGNTSTKDAQAQQQEKPHWRY